MSMNKRLENLAEQAGLPYYAWDNTDGASFADFARLIETKSRSKNNG